MSLQQITAPSKIEAPRPGPRTTQTCVKNLQTPASTRTRTAKGLGSPGDVRSATGNQAAAKDWWKIAAKL